MEVVCACLDVRYRSEVLYTIPTHMNDLEMSDLEVKGTDIEKIMLKFLVKFLEAKHELGKLLFPIAALIHIVLLITLRTVLSHSWPLNVWSKLVWHCMDQF